MADAISAGTLVGAVLETAGYVTQERVLDDFRTFFSLAGQYLYIVAAVGALFSVTLFGSYRMARYLLLGPFLFWILISQRVEIDGAYWALGKNEPRAVNSVFKGELEEMRPDGKIRVAYPFYIFTKAVSDVVNSLVTMVLRQHDNEDLLFLDRRYALDVLINAQPQKPRLIGILWENLYANCEKMMNVALAFSHSDISETALHYFEVQAQNDPDPLKRTDGAGRAKDIRDRREQLKHQFNEAARIGKTELSPQTREFMSAYAEKYRYVERFNLPGTTDADLAQVSLSCGAMWEVSKDAIMEDAQVILNHVELELNDASQMYNKDVVAADENVLCKTLAKKLVHNEPGAFRVADQNCNLVEVVSSFLLRNLIIGLPRSQQASLIKNKSHYYASTRRIMPTRLSHEDEAPQVAWETARFRYNPSCGGTNTGEGCYEVLVKPGSQNQDEDWRSYELIESVGHIDAAYYYHQNYQSNYLQQGIFSYALQLPYFQGCMLYFLSLSYPFMALLLVTPGHAAKFLHLPLFWIWIKSWDIGFALVMILEKVLWNLLPNSKVPYDIFSNTEKYGLPDVLVSAFSIDPAFDIHAHYNFISMALYAIPPITGYAVMKGKYSVLSSFVDAPKEDGDEAGQVAQGRYGMGVMNDMIMGMKRSEGQTLRGVRWQGKGNDGREGWAIGFAAIAGGVEAVEAAASTTNTLRGRRALNSTGSAQASDAINHLGQAMKSGMSTYAKMRNKQLDVDAYREMAYGPYKEHRKRMGAIFAAMDAFGEHELAHFLEGRQQLDREINLKMTEAAIVLDAGNKVLGALQSRMYPTKDQRYQRGGFPGGYGEEYAIDAHGNRVQKPNGNFVLEKTSRPNNSPLEPFAGFIMPVVVKELIYEEDTLNNLNIGGDYWSGVKRQEWIRTKDGLGFQLQVITEDGTVAPPPGSGLPSVPKEPVGPVKDLLLNSDRNVIQREEGKG